MGKLDELKEGLYAKDAEGAIRPVRRPTALPRQGSDVGLAWEERARETPEKIMNRSLKKISLILGIASFLFIAGGAIFVLLSIGRGTAEAAIQIQSRDSLEAGEIFTIPITFTNSSKVMLQNVELVITLPPGSLVEGEGGVEQPAPPHILKYADDLIPGRVETVEVSTRMFGAEGDMLFVQADLSYKPENLQARFSAHARREIRVASVPIAFSWEAPEKLAQKQDVVLRAHIHSSARGALTDLWARIDYPPGFTFASAEPKPDADTNLWNIGILAPDQETVIAVHGAIVGTGGEVKAFRGGVGSYNDRTKEWKPWRESVREFSFTASPLSLDVTMGNGTDSVVSPGDKLGFTIHYRNNSSVPLNNVSVRSSLEGGIVDESSFSVGQGGVPAPGDHAVVWNPGGTPELGSVAPGAGGNLTFRVNVRPRPAVRSADDKNLTIRVRSKIDAASIPAQLAGTQVGMEDILELKVRSLVQFSGRSLFRVSPIPTGGPLPPRVGAKTVYTLVWELRDFTDDLENAEVQASVPPNAAWEGKVYPNDAAVTFDGASGRVRWRIGKIAAGTGVLSPALTAAFQVSVTPASADVGKTLTLLGKSQLTAHDTFTNEARVEEIDSLTMETRQDSLTTNSDWAVAK
ncbi:MAG: DUF11 domain-containing protein [Candidatus Sungbacteria bacterium]|uniref:DUF11 domain-containing protein n=1 Tax=Candidatus Sungiibacteriota bacterium TaxID=2750080 RepID=A0A932R2E2_9BACT|nr:DUF11 domain-containing protein [Candidatus Sungbacteria bacterium]